jgi:hypothetical protein
MSMHTGACNAGGADGSREGASPTCVSQTREMPRNIVGPDSFAFLSGREKSQVGQSLSSLPAEKRAKLYREFAADAIRRSQAATDEILRADHLSMAAGWRALAVEVEHTADRFDHLDSVPDSHDDRPLPRR